MKNANHPNTGLSYSATYLLLPYKEMEWDDQTDICMFIAIVFIFKIDLLFIKY